MSNQLLLRRRTSCISDKRPNYLKFTALEDSCTLSLNKVGSPTDHPTEYSLNKGAFMPYVFGTTINFDEGDTIEWRRVGGYESNSFSTDENNCYKFDVTGNIHLNGFVTTLLSWKNDITAIDNKALIYLFDTSISLTGNINLPDGILSIGISNFRNWNVTGNIIFPSSVTTFGGYICMDSKFTGTVELPPLITAIPNSTFRGCPNITHIIVSSKVTALGSYCFFGLNSFQALVLLPENPPSVATNVISYAQLPIYVPYSTDHSVLAAYKAAPYWSNRANYIFELDENGEIPS